LSEPDLIDSPIAARVVRDDHELVDVYGMAIPAVIDDPLAEYEAVRQGAGLLDFSPLLKVDVEGPGAREKISRLHSRDITKLAPGRIAYGAILDDEGLMVDDSTVMVRAEDRIRVVGGPGMPGAVIPFAEEHGLTAVERRDELAHLNVQGPRSREIVSELTSEDFTNGGFPYYTLARCQSFLPSRTGKRDSVWAGRCHNHQWTGGRSRECPTKTWKRFTFSYIRWIQLKTTLPLQYSRKSNRHQTTQRFTIRRVLISSPA
jgi:glycine cleavage system aminomethyltransferase T